MKQEKPRRYRGFCIFANPHLLKSTVESLLHVDHKFAFKGKYGVFEWFSHIS